MTEYNGELLVHQEDNKAIVRKADDRVAFARKDWEHLVSVSYHSDLLVDGAASFEDTEDGTELRMTVGAENEGIGQVTYRVADTTRDLILLEKVR